jgi:hypothetical protein
MIPALEHTTALSPSLEHAAASTPPWEHAAAVLFLKLLVIVVPLPSTSILPPLERTATINLDPAFL